MKRDMRIAAVPVALLSIVVGIVGIVSPDGMMALRRLYFATPGLFCAVVAVRFAAGLDDEQAIMEWEGMQGPALLRAGWPSPWQPESSSRLH